MKFDSIAQAFRALRGLPPDPAQPSAAVLAHGLMDTQTNDPAAHMQAGVLYDAAGNVIAGASAAATFASATLSAVNDPTTIPTETRALNDILLRQKWAMGAEECIVVSDKSFTSDSSGTGAACLINFGQARAISGTDAGGRGACFSQNGIGALLNSIGGRYGYVDYSKPMWLTVLFSAGSNKIGSGNDTTISDNGFVRWTVGKTNGNGALGTKGFGFLLTKSSSTLAAVKILTYDSSLHTSATIGTIDFQSSDSGNGPFIHAITFFLDGAGNLHVFLDDVYKTVIATGPTGESSACNVVFEANGGGDVVSNEGCFLELRSSVKKN